MFALSVPPAYSAGTWNSASHPCSNRGADLASVSAFDDVALKKDAPPPRTLFPARLVHELEGGNDPLIAREAGSRFLVRTEGGNGGDIA